MGAVSTPSEDLALALELADVADAITRAHYRASDLKVTTKPDLTPVSEADTEAERAIRSQLAAERPGDAVMGEEYGDESDADARRRWIIDPIDGTQNYVRGVPVWASLLALELDGEVMVGVVSAPALGRRWWATRGGGAFAADPLTHAPRRLGVSAVASLEDAHVSVAGLEVWIAGARRDDVLALVGRCARTRGFGDFWAHMLVAEGVVDVAIDSPGVAVWDLAALQVIVEEAGGRLSDLRGVRTVAGGEAVASNGVLHDDVLAIVGR